MTVSELKKKLELLEQNNLGDVEVYFDEYGCNYSRIDGVEIANHYPVIVLGGFPMEDDGDFESMIDFHGRETIDENWTPKTE